MACRTCDMIRGLLLSQGAPESAVAAAMPLVAIAEKKGKRVVKRKASAYAKRYGKAFKKIASKYKKKNGAWKRDGFKLAQKAAHRLAKK